MRTVAQISNLLYRRFAIGKEFDISSSVLNSGRPQNGILRYSRLEICVTTRRTGP